MSEFLGFAWELLAKVVYNVVAVVSSILNLLVFGWVEYFNIFMTSNTFCTTIIPRSRILCKDAAIFPLQK